MVACEEKYPYRRYMKARGCVGANRGKRGGVYCVGGWM